MTTESPSLIVVCGPTATGKTDAAIRLARHLSSEIISADSRQFYREMKIGTASPSDEQRAAVYHHFSGHLSVNEDYNVSRFESDALAGLEQLFRRMPVVIMAGGSGLYIDAVCKGIDRLPDPEPPLREELKREMTASGIFALQQKLKELDPKYYSQVDLLNPARLIRALEVCITTGMPYSSFRTSVPKKRPFRIIKTALFMPREELNRAIGDRVERMMAEGWIDEARRLLPFKDKNALNTVGYKELFAYLGGTLTYEAAVEKIKTSTRRYAKRQLTWFRKDKEINWFLPSEYSRMLEYVNKQLSISA